MLRKSYWEALFGSELCVEQLSTEMEILSNNRSLILLALFLGNIICHI